MSKHPIIHVEFSANDREAAAQFYHDIFDWEIQHMPEMTYLIYVR
jgi:predicted enzyme related to lactoylglutathione lyase